MADSQPVFVRSETGEVGSVPADQLNKALEEGYQIARPEDVQAAQDKVTYGSSGAAAATAAINAADMLALGLGKPAAIYGTKLIAGQEAADKVRHTIGALDANNPVSRIGGSALGLIGPQALEALVGKVGTGVAATGLRTLAAPGNAVSGLGGLAERGVARLVGEGAESLAGRVAQSAIPMVARGAVEGGVFGATGAVSEAAIENKPLTAEHLLASTGYGSLVGGALGGLFGAAAPVIEKGAEKFAGIRGGLSGLAERKAFEALGPTAATYAKLGRTAEAAETEARTIGRTLLDNDIVKATDSISDIAKKAGAKADEVGGRLESMVKKLDEDSVVRPSVPSIVERVNQEVVAPLAAMPGTGTQVRAVERYINDFAKKAGDDPSFEKLWQFRKNLDEQIYKQVKSLDPKGTVGELRKVRGIIEDELTQAGEKGANQIGGTFAKEYSETKRLYGQLKTASETANKASMKAAAAPSVTFRDLAMDHVFGGGITGLAGAGISHVVRQRFDQIAAGALNAISKRSAAVGLELEKGVDRFVTDKALPTNSISKTADLKQTYKHYVDTVSKVANNPVAVSERVAAATGHMANHAPQTVSELSAVTQRATEFLQSKMPKGNVAADSLTPRLLKPRVSDADMAKFVRYAKAVDRPQTVIEDLSKGTVSREAVEAIKTVYPQMFASIQSRVMERLTDLQKELPYTKRLQLGILLDIPADETLKPGFVKAMQDTFIQGASAHASQSSGKPQRPVNVAKFVMPTTDAIGIDGRQ